MKTLKQIPNLESLTKIFFADKLGNVYSDNKTGKSNLRKIKQIKHNKGYKYINVIDPQTKKIKTHLVHRLVWSAFNPDVEDFDKSHEYHINHINGVRDDNRLTNLELISQIENFLHSRQIKNKLSKYSYVQHKPNGFYTAHIPGDNIYLGSFANPEEAANKIYNHFINTSFPKYLVTVNNEGEKIIILKDQTKKISK